MFGRLLVACLLAVTTLEEGMAQSRFVLATYRVAEEKQEKFLALLEQTERVLREVGLITDRPAIRMRSEDPELLLEVFEWVDGEAFEKAQRDPRVLELWGKLEGVWTDGAVPLAAFPEASSRWAQLEAVGRRE